MAVIALGTFGAIAGSIYGIATGAPVVPVVTVALYAIGTLRLLAQRAKGEYVAYGSDNFYVWLTSPLTVPIHAISLLADGWDRLQYARKQAKRDASEGSQD